MEYIYSKTKSPKFLSVFLMLALAVPVFMVPTTASAVPPTPLSPVVTATAEGCGTMDPPGSITVNFTGGSNSPVLVSISPDGDTTNNPADFPMARAGLTAGDYQVVVTQNDLIAFDQTVNVPECQQPQDPTGTIEITKYTCPADTVPSRDANGPDSSGNHTNPTGCTPQSGAYFSYENSSAGTYPGLDGSYLPIPGFKFDNVMGTTVSGVLTASVPANGQAYNIAETDSSGVVLPSILGLYCNGDIDTSKNDNYEQIPSIGAGETKYCVAYNKSEEIPPASTCTDGIMNQDETGIDTGGVCTPASAPAPLARVATSGGGGSSGSRHRDISGLLASNSSVGGVEEVLGASTGPACEEYLKSYIKLGANNDPEEVKKLQIFLNQFFEVKNPVTGFYGPITYGMVKKFQTHQNVAVLTPWAIAGFPTDGPTGYVYKTTKRWINILKCPETVVSSPIPFLP